MQQISLKAEEGLRGGLKATADALGHYEAACRAMQGLPQTRVVADQLELSRRRLASMGRDLDRRAQGAANVDALYVGLNVLHAGLLSLAEATGRMRHAYYEVLSPPPAAEGWFIDEMEAAPAGTPDPDAAEGATEPQ